MSSLLPILIILFYLSAWGIPLLKRVGVDNPALILSILPAFTFILLFFELLHLERDSLALIESGWGFMETMRFTWRLDGLSILFALLISGVGFLVMLFAYYYMADYQRKGHFYTYLIIFMGSMLGLSLTDNLLLLYLFWELSSVAAFFLIGFHHHYKKVRRAAVQTLIIQSFGSLALLFSVILTGHIAETYRINELLNSSIHLGNHPYYPLLLTLILISALTKSAQFPFHFWMSRSMTTPSPVNIYLFSATFINAGVFLLFRLHPIMGGTFIWRYVLILLGGISMFLGAFLAIGQRDFKKILAYTTISTLGVMILLIGIDTSTSLKAALLLFIIHALYKGSLFMSAGIVYKCTHTHKIHRIGGLLKFLPITALLTLLSLISMAGVPPVISSLGKDLIHSAKLQIPGLSWLLVPLTIGTNILMVGVSIILFFELFMKRATLQSVSIKCSERDLPFYFLLIPAVLSVLGFVLGLSPALLEVATTNALYYVQSRFIYADLTLWEGFDEALILSIFTLLSGILIFLIRRPIFYRIIRLTKWLNQQFKSDSQ